MTPRLQAGRLWAGGAATAVVAALTAVTGIVITRALSDATVLAPQGDGSWGAANTTNYALCAAGAALTATALLHLLAATTPRFARFFTWIGTLLTAIATALPLGLGGSSALATAIINFVIGVVIVSTLNGVARSAVVRG
ncbi:DUF6069 family protein [Amycolatopsis sp. NPDC004378]